MLKDSDKAINERVKSLRKELKLSQAQFAHKLEMQQSYYSEIERGNRDVNSRMLQSLMVEFDVSSDWLLSGKGDKFITKYDISKEDQEREYKNWDLIHENFGKYDLDGIPNRTVFTIQDIFTFHDLMSSNEELNKVWTIGSKLSGLLVEFGMYMDQNYKSRINDLMIDHKLTYKNRKSGKKFFEQNNETIKALVGIQPILEEALNDFIQLLKNIRKLDKEDTLLTYFSPNDLTDDKRIE